MGEPAMCCRMGISGCGYLSMESVVTEQADDSPGVAEPLSRVDQEALAALFAEHHPRLWRMIRFRMDRRLIGRVDPDDVLQESYLAAAGRLKDYERSPTCAPFVWLRTMVMQTLTDLHRRHLGAQMRDAGREIGRQDLRFPHNTSASLAAQFVGHLTSPSQAAVRAEAYAQVEQVIVNMEPLDREVLALRHFEELTNSEIAEVLGIQQKAASIRYVRAVKRLKSILSQIPGLLEGDHDA